jgi:hypothetical protein
MQAWRSFRRAMGRLHDGLQQPEVLALLGPPDLVHDGDAKAGIDFSWEYHERLPEHRDLIVNFAGGAVCCSTLRHIPDAQQRHEFRKHGHPYSA